MNEHVAPVVGERHSKKKRQKQKLFVIIGVVLLISIGVWVSYLALRNSSVSSHIEGNKYQAVFFTNGQVYFGKLSPLAGGYMKLQDIYYLQTKSSTDAGNPQATAEDNSNDVELIKLGNEIHGPEDEMIISKDQVLFFENLKQDSTVSSSIKKSQDQQQK
jgi:hypothetical protein